MNDQTVPFKCIYEIFDVTATELETHAEILADLYDVDQDEFYAELLSFRVLYAGKVFAHFSDFAKFVLLQSSETDYPLIHFFTQIILILSFATADCERSFSAMNRIKSAERRVK